MVLGKTRAPQRSATYPPTQSVQTGCTPIEVHYSVDNELRVIYLREKYDCVNFDDVQGQLRVPSGVYSVPDRPPLAIPRPPRSAPPTARSTAHPYHRVTICDGISGDRIRSFDLSKTGVETMMFAPAKDGLDTTYTFTQRPIHPWVITSADEATFTANLEEETDMRFSNVGGELKVEGTGFTAERGTASGMPWYKSRTHSHEKQILRFDDRAISLYPGDSVSFALPRLLLLGSAQISTGKDQEA